MILEFIIGCFVLKDLAKEIDKWFSPELIEETKKMQKTILASGGVTRRVYAPMINRQKGLISKWDALFQKHAPAARLDWRLLAAQCYQESCFDPQAHSWAGACGLMQLMPRTAANYGCPDSLMQDPEESVKAGTALLADLENRLRKKNIEHDLVYFTLAGFHAGLGHIYDAITMADSLGYDPTLWHDNVEVCLQLKADPDYYNLPYVRLGRFNGKVTSAYIREVLDYHVAFKTAK